MDYDNAIENPVDYVDYVQHEVSSFIHQLHGYLSQTTDTTLLAQVLTTLHIQQQRIGVLRHTVVHMKKVMDELDSKLKEKDDHKINLMKELLQI
jgi:hypothetical protein